MVSLNWILCFVCICWKVAQKESKSWTVNVPSSVKGLPGSCVVIPCSYDFPDPGKELSKFTGMWKDARDQLIYHPVESEIMQQYRKRTKLVGDLRQKNCSLEIDPLRENDQGSFYFRIEIEGHNKYSYSHNRVSISITSELYPIRFSEKDIRDGQTVSAHCSVFHFCPSSPPVLTWSHSGKTDFQQEQLKDGQWKATSTLTFEATRADNNKSLECAVRYKGGQDYKTYEVLHVNYAPEIRATSSCTSVVDMMTCECIVESQPPSTVHFMLPNRVLPSIKVEHHGNVTIGTLQTEIGRYEFVLCLANNTQGNASLTISASPVYSKIHSLYITLAAGIGVLFLILLIAVGSIKKCRGRSGAAPTTHMKANEDAVLPQKQTKNHDDEHSAGIDFVDHIYSNVETDQPIYGNIR